RNKDNGSKLRPRTEPEETTSVFVFDLFYLKVISALKSVVEGKFVHRRGKMQFTPESNVYHESCKGQHCHEGCCDSGYSGLFHSPQSVGGVDFSRSLSPVDFNETPKENLRLSATPKVRTRELVRFLDKDSKGVQRPPAVSWCETPKLYKRDASLRQRFRMCKPTTDVKTDNTRSPCTRRTEASASGRSVYEDSGFSSLTLDKSQDSSVDHDGSFQELLLSASRRNSETPNQAEARRRSRLQRQHRLSTLKEGGSQSEEEPTDRRHQLHQCHSESKDDVFAEGATPRSGLSIKCGNSFTPCSTAPANPDVTPLRTTPVDLSLTPALQLVHAMCQQKAHMFAGQSPSLQEQLKSTAELVETPAKFRTTIPLAGLIGRKMGLGNMDILTELRKRSLWHILSVILGHLTSESIYRCGQVCKSWKKIIQHDKQANVRRQNHLSELKAALELGGSVHVPDTETRLTLLKRSALKTVQPQSRSSSFCTPQSANSTLIQSKHNVTYSGSSSKREKFLEVAKTLFSDECLKPCPRCQHPARCHSVKGEGVCSRADCGFQFCTSCLCDFHGSRECGSRSAGRRKNDIILPGSAQSKRNVRRL
ncbi:hypothetical protein INR49_032502, partial [Caranx melampygus]